VEKTTKDSALIEDIYKELGINTYTKNVLIGTFIRSPTVKDIKTAIKDGRLSVSSSRLGPVNFSKLCVAMGLQEPKSDKQKAMEKRVKGAVKALGKKGYYDLQIVSAILSELETVGYMVVKKRSK